MKRLTKKVNHHNTYKLVDDIFDYDNAINKLGQLENIEDELGIKLITLFKALKQGIYYLIDNKIEFSFCMISNQDLLVKNNFYIMIRDYGKTWALTKEELK